MPFQGWPFSNLHNVNLNWILTQLQEVFRRLTELQDRIDRISISTGVLSVNGKSGVVTLNAEDVGALPITTPIPSRISDLKNDLGFQTGQEVQTAINAALSEIPFAETEAF